MISPKISPLRLEAPRLTADAALGEHLAALARSSAPSAAPRMRPSGWGVPLAAAATIAASSGVAFAGQAAISGGFFEARAAVASPVASVAQQASASATASVSQVPKPVESAVANNPLVVAGPTATGSPSASEPPRGASAAPSPGATKGDKSNRGKGQAKDKPGKGKKAKGKAKGPQQGQKTGGASRNRPVNSTPKASRAFDQVNARSAGASGP